MLGLTYLAPLLHISFLNKPETNPLGFFIALKWLFLHKTIPILHKLRFLLHIIIYYKCLKQDRKRDIKNMLLIRFTYYLPFTGKKVVGFWLDASKISIEKMDLMAKRFKMYNSKFVVEYKEA